MMKFNVYFRNNLGQTISLIFNPNRTVDEILTAYLKKIKKQNLMVKKTILNFYLMVNFYFLEIKL